MAASNNPQFLFYFLIGIWFLYNAVLVSAVQSEGVYISPPSWVSLPPPPSQPSRSSQSTKLSSLCYTEGSHLAICFTQCNICQCYSLSSSHILLPPQCPHICSLYLPFYSCPANRFISIIFLNSICVLTYYICFSLSDLVHSVWKTLGSSTSDSILFHFMAE